MEIRDLYAAHDKATYDFDIDTYKDLTQKVNASTATNEEIIEQAFLFLAVINIKTCKGLELFKKSYEKYQTLSNNGKMTIKEMYEVKKQCKKGKSVEIKLTGDHRFISKRFINATIVKTYCKIYQKYSTDKYVSCNVSCEEYFTTDSMIAGKDYVQGLSFVVDCDDGRYELTPADMIYIKLV